MLHPHAWLSDVSYEIPQTSRQTGLMIIPQIEVLDSSGPSSSPMASCLSFGTKEPTRLPKFASVEIVRKLANAGLMVERGAATANVALGFIEAINLELTYDCNRTCAHCLQNQVRSDRSGLSTALLKLAN